VPSKSVLFEMRAFIERIKAMGVESQTPVTTSRNGYCLGFFFEKSLLMLAAGTK